MKLMRIVYNFGFYIQVKSKRYGDMVYSKRRISIKNLQNDLWSALTNEVGRTRWMYNVISEETIRFYIQRHNININ